MSLIRKMAFSVPVLLSGRGATAFDPASYGTVLTYHDSLGANAFYQDSGRTTPATSESDVIGSFTDQSGSGHHYAQPTTSLKPLLTGGAADFDGTDDVMITDNIVLPAAFTIFTIVNIDAIIVTQTASLWSYTTGIGDSAAEEINIYNASGTYRIRLRYGGVIDTFGSATYSIDDPVGNAVLVGVTRVSTTSIITEINGTLLHNNITTTSDHDTTNKKFRVARHVNSGQYLDGTIPLQLAYGEALDTTTRATVAAELMTRYGVTA